MVKEDVSDDYGKYYMTYEYNDIGQLARISTYQFDVVVPGEFFMVSYIDYQYDEGGRLSQRENYNRDRWGGTGGYIKGGRITYTYDETGKLSLLSVHMDWGGAEMVLQKTEYSYNDRGLRTEEVYWQVDFSDPTKFSPTSKIAYVYDERERMVQKRWYTFVNDGVNPAEPELQTVNEYAYEEGVGLMQYQQRNKNGNVIHKRVYTFTAESASETIYPYDIEAADNNFLYDNVEKRIAVCTEYASDVNTGDLVLYDEFTYHYLPQEGSLPAVALPSTAVFVTSEGGKMAICGLRAGDAVTFYSAEGRSVATATAAGARLAVPELQAGSYIAVTPAGAVKFIMK